MIAYNESNNVVTMSVLIEMKLYIRFFQTIANGKLINLKFLPLFQLHSPCQLVVLNGRIANCHYIQKIITNDSK